MSATSHDPRRDDLAAYLLGALDPTEAAGLEGHLAGCEECRRELERLRPAALVLPETVERLEPPPGLRSRVLEEVRSDAAGPDDAPAKPRRRWGDWLRPGGLRVAAGLAAFIVLAAVVVGLAARGGDSGGGATTAFAGKSPGVTAEMVREGNTGMLRLSNVHQLPPNRVLQAWVQRGRTVESADVLFAPNSDGIAAAVIDDMHGVDIVMVTTEPRGGSTTPTSKPLVSIPVSSS
jgi:anti-sigma-K factor RskA